MYEYYSQVEEKSQIQKKNMKKEKNENYRNRKLEQVAWHFKEVYLRSHYNFFPTCNSCRLCAHVQSRVCLLGGVCKCMCVVSREIEKYRREKYVTLFFFFVSRL